MTEQQKQKIAEYRARGMSYSTISAEIGIASNSIKSYCQRKGLGGIRSTVGRGANIATDPCEQCGKNVKQQKGRKHKRFCSDACRMAWWGNHRDQIQQKTIHTFCCKECGEYFERYGIRERKFCSSKCYIAHRFHYEVNR